jgi:hypothetical protein
MKYSRALNATYLDAQGQQHLMEWGAKRDWHYLTVARQLNSTTMRMVHLADVAGSSGG